MTLKRNRNRQTQHRRKHKKRTLSSRRKNRSLKRKKLKFQKGGFLNQLTDTLNIGSSKTFNIVKLIKTLNNYDKANNATTVQNLKGNLLLLASIDSNKLQSSLGMEHNELYNDLYYFVKSNLIKN